jgi:hypothetical protein
MKDKRLVLVEWVDSGEGRGWTPIEDIVREPMVCRSVGWLIHETEKGITVAAHYGGRPVAAGVWRYADPEGGCPVGEGSHRGHLADGEDPGSPPTLRQEEVVVDHRRTLTLVGIIASVVVVAVVAVVAR